MRNLVLMHLESLNYTNYRTNKEFFPNLLYWEEKSLSFSKYFSTATSTLMVIGDLLYGGMLQYESCDNMNSIPERYCYQESLFDYLKEIGYMTRLLYYPGGEDCKSAKERYIAGFRNDLEAFTEYGSYFAEIERSLDTEKPFALLLCNAVSNVALNHKISDCRFDSGLDRRRRGYQYMDVCVDEVMRLLEKKGCMDNTTIIFYGDHGDDYFAHGVHNGLTHAIEPYAGLIHTPFWIYDDRLVKKGNCQNLLSTLDIREITEKLLEMPEEEFEWDELGIFSREYVIARNAYAAQPVRKNSFNKGYCLTDGRFLFMASNLGMEMYDIEMDLLCQNNLLRFFVYEEGILHVDRELNSNLSYHYLFIIDMGAIRQIRQNFYYYREKLREEAGRLFQHAECPDKMKELDFENIHQI
jgi:hypothetical protein